MTATITAVGPDRHEPVYALTGQQIEDLRNDAHRAGFRAGYQLGLVHGEEQAVDLGDVLSVGGAS